MVGQDGGDATPGPMTQRIAVATGAADRVPESDPRLDLVAESITLPPGRLEFLRPRGAMELVYEQNFDATEKYPPYWAELWPSGVELARRVSATPLDGATVLELGCGLGLPAIAAALAGGRVLATDRSPDAVAFTGANALRSGVTLETEVCDWAAPEPVTSRAPWDLVLAADVLYGDRNITELLALLPRLVDGTGEVWIADPRRPLARDFLAAARERWSSVTTVATAGEVEIHRLAGPG